jgi:hypothetical protein
VSGLVHIAVEILICENGAADRSYAGYVAVNYTFLLQLVDALGNQAVYYAVVAAGAVVELLIGQVFGSLEYN